MKKNLKRTLSFGVIVIVLALLILPKTGLFSDNKEVTNQGPGASGLPVSVVVVEQGVMENVLKAAGTLMASEEITVTTEISGIVRSIHFEEGRQVKKGDLLVKIDDAELQAQRDKSVYQKALIEQTLERQRVLLEKEAISRESFDKIQTDLLVIDAELKLLNTQIEKKQIRAPFDGIVGFRSVSPGTYLQPGARIARLVKSSPLRLEFSVPERYQSADLSGRNVFFSVAGYDETFEAQVYALEPSVDAQTRSLLLRALYPNSDLRLIPGMFADLSIIISRDEDVMQIPSEAIIPQMEGEQVYVYRGGKAELKNVKTGKRTEHSVAVLEGVSVGDTVITSGILQLRSGMAVVIR
jgi:membrane fusion protein (multidrug efflux system)